jgi:hypothetical protein
MDGKTPKVLGPRDGSAGFLGSIGVRFMIDSSESGGGFSLVEHPMSARALGAPLHRHGREDEYSYVVEGRVGRSLVTTRSKPAQAISSSNRAASGTRSGTQVMSRRESSK